MRRLPLLIVVLLVLTACAAIGTRGQFDTLFGPAEPSRFDQPRAPAANDVSYTQTIQPILDKRCVVCHACYDAPCQLKTTSWEGIARGASKMRVYDAARLLSAEPTRLYVDADKASQWRDKSFFPMLNEQAAQTPEANRTAGLMHRLLALKQQHPLPAGGTVPADLDVSNIDRAQTCPAGPEIDAYEKRNPQGGMPFGLPGLPGAEHQTLSRWLEQGAPAEAQRPPSSLALQRVAQWERFFNGDSRKEQLFARYAYEHLFLAHLYFDDDKERRYFKLLRSSTPPGQPVAEIAARRPVDDPGVARVYYRLVPERESIVAKTHMPYALGAARMARWRSLFLAPAYTVDQLPGYGAEAAANPFKTFRQLPVAARYAFMLDEAEFTIMGFIKGPVCRGQMALDVIDDRFWVFFQDPSNANDEALASLLAGESDMLRLPTGSSNVGLLAPWLHYAEREKAYLETKSQALARTVNAGAKLDLSMLWDGEGRNPNAALTVLRHFDSATVVKGLVGEQPPKTAWVIGYPLLERIHYLLVALYDVYGNVGHQLNSRLYMDFMRMEGEFNFLIFLPEAQREAVRDGWYRGDSESTRQQVYGGPARLDAETGIRYRTSDPKNELLGLLQRRMAPLSSAQFASLQGEKDAALRAQLLRLAAVRGASLSWANESSVLAVEAPGQPTRWFSLLRDTGHNSISYFLREKAQLRPDENTLTVVPGVLGSYPNAFYRVQARELPAFTEALGRLASEADYAAFSERFAVRRTDPGFWAFSDALHTAYAREQPLAAGILDYNRLENR